MSYRDVLDARRRWLPDIQSKAASPQPVSLEALKDLFRSGWASRSGAVINLMTAVQVAAVLACCRAVATGLASVPLELLQRQGSSFRQRPDHPAAQLLADPSAWQTEYDFVETMVLHIMLAGRSAHLRTTYELILLEPGWVRVDDQKFEPRFDVMIPNSAYLQDLGRDRVLLVQGMGAGRLAWEPVKLAREALGLSLAAENFSSALFRNGVRPSGAFSLKDDLDAEQEKAWKERVREYHEGADNAGRIMLLTNGAQWLQTQMSAVDAETIAMRRFAVEEVCRFFGVDPLMAYSAEMGTNSFASVEAKFGAHTIQALLPMARRIEKALAKTLLSPADKAAGLYFKFNLAGLLRGSTKDRGDFYAQALGAGGHAPFMTVNEVRALEELPPIAGGDQLPERAGAAPAPQGGTNGA